MKFKAGDLVIEDLGDNYWLVLLTDVVRDKAEGWVIDHDVDEEYEPFKPYHTQEKDIENGDEAEVNLEWCELLECSSKSKNKQDDKTN